MAALDELPRCWAVKVHGSVYQAAGVPDILGVIDGRAFGIEVKTETGKTSKLQELTMRRMREAGAIAGVARSVQDALELLSEQGEIRRDA